MQPKKQTVPFKGTPEQEKALKDAIHQLKEEKGINRRRKYLF